MSAKKHNLNPDRLNCWLHRFQNTTQEQRDEIMREERE
jgi:hypothetical protein